MAVISSRQLLIGGLAHEDPLVRAACLDHLHELPRPGLEVTSAALAALDRHGPDAFPYPHMLKRLPIDGPAMDWVERHVERFDWHGQWNRVFHYLAWMTSGPLERLPALLGRLEGDYAARAPEHAVRLPVAFLRNSAARRLGYGRLAAMDCFDALTACFLEADELGNFPDELFADAEVLADRLLELQRPADLRPLVEEWLDFDPDGDDSPARLSTAIGAYLAGHCGCTDLWRRLVRLFDLDHDWLNDYVMEACSRMADHWLLARLRDAFADLSWDARLYLAAVFERHPLPGFEEFCEAMTEPWEGGDPIRNSFAMALALYGTPRTLAAAQRCYDADPDEPESQAFGQMLYAQYRLRGIDHPDVPWMRRKFAEDQARFEARCKALESRLSGAPSPVPAPLPAPAAPSGPPGRNDPCPCGSGRKFKKCCLGKA